MSLVRKRWKEGRNLEGDINPISRSIAVSYTFLNILLSFAPGQEYAGYINESLIVLFSGGGKQRTFIYENLKLHSTLTALDQWNSDPSPET